MVVLLKSAVKAVFMRGLTSGVFWTPSEAAVLASASKNNYNSKLKEAKIPKHIFRWKENLLAVSGERVGFVTEKKKIQ